MKLPIASSIAVLTLLAVPGTAALGAKDEPITDPARLEQALKACTGQTKTRERRQQAAAACTQVIQSPAAEDDAKFTALMTRGQLDQYDWKAQALADFDAAIALRPDSGLAHYWRGVMLNRLDSKESPLAAFDKAISLDPDFVEAHLARADRLAIEDRPNEALEAYGRAIELAPDSAPPLTARGRLYAKLGNDELALADYGKAIVLKPDDVFALTQRGTLYAKLGQDDLALGDFDKAIAVTSKTDAVDLGARRGKAAVLYRRAHDLFDTGAYEQSVKAYSTAMELVYDSAAQVRRGEAYYALGQYKQALADFDNVIANAQRRREELKRESESGGRGSSRAGDLLSRMSPPKDALEGRKKALCRLEGGKDCDPTKSTETTDTERGTADSAMKELVALCNAKDPAKAVDGCTRILDSKSLNLAKKDRGYVLHQRGRAYLNQNSLRPAMLDFTAALNNGAAPEPVLIDRGRLFVRAKEYQEAIKDLTAALNANGENGTTYYFRAAANAGAGQLDLAAQDFETALRLLSSDFSADASAESHLEKAKVHHQRGQLGAAANEYLHAAVLAKPGSPTRIQALEFLSRANLAIGKPEIALASVSDFLAQKPGYAPGHNTRGMIYLKLNKNDEAIADFNEALRLDPERYAWAYLSNRGEAYFNLGKFDLALKDLDESLRRNPDNEDAKAKKAEAEAALAKQN